MKRPRRFLPLILVALSFSAFSCFDIEQSLVLNKDLSGKAGFRMTVDFEPMILIMAQMSRDMEGKKGAPTKEEIAKAKADFLKSKKEESSGGDFEKDKAELNKKLPKGVRLLDAGVAQNEMKMTTNFAFSFENPSALASIEFPKKDAKEGGDPSKANVVDKPFSGLTVKEEGRNIIVRGQPVDPMTGVKNAQSGAEGGADKANPQNDEMSKMIESSMKGLRVAYKIEAPFKIVETNATRRDGNTLYWEYTLDTLQTLEKSGGKIEAVYVKYAR